MNKKILLAGAIVLLISMMAIPTLAKPPDHYSYSFDELPMVVADCGGFSVETKDYVIYVDESAHYDNEGSISKIISHWSGEGYFWNPDSGKTVFMESRLFNSFYYPETGETISSGIQFKLTLPGEGTILMDVGRIIFEPYPEITFAAGQHPFYFPEEGGLEKICAYFAD